MKAFANADDPCLTRVATKIRLGACRVAVHSARARLAGCAHHSRRATDPHVCPVGERLSTTDASKVGNTPLTHDVNYQGCRVCTVRERRTTARYRAIACYVNEAVVDRMAKRLARYPDILKRQVMNRVNRHEDRALYGAGQTVTVLAVIPAPVPGDDPAIVEEGAPSMDEIESAMAETVSLLAPSQWNCICLAVRHWPGAVSRGDASRYCRMWGAAVPVATSLREKGYSRRNDCYRRRLCVRPSNRRADAKKHIVPGANRTGLCLTQLKGVFQKGATCSSVGSAQQYHGSAR